MVEIEEQYIWLKHVCWRTVTNLSIVLRASRGEFKTQVSYRMKHAAYSELDLFHFIQNAFSFDRRLHRGKKYFGGNF